MRSPVRKLLRTTGALALAAGTWMAATGTAHAYSWYRLDIDMQAQQNTNWCWAAAGNTVAAYYGHSYSQNQFCNLAFNRALNSGCPNNQATLANDQNAFRTIGISPGNYLNGYLSYSTIIRNIDAHHPVMARIQWTSGGGHMQTIYGYDQSRSWVYWGDPWPSTTRYNWATYNWYVGNSNFFWTHSLHNIGA